MEDFTIWASALRPGYLEQMIWFNYMDRVPPNLFYTWLPEYMNTSCTENSPCGSAKVMDVKVDYTNDVVTASRMTTQLIGLNSTRDFLDAMLDLRADLKKAVDKTSFEKSFVYSSYFVYFEQYIVIQAETYRNMGVAIAVTFIVILMVTGQFQTPRDALLSIYNCMLIVLTIAGMAITLLGVMSWWHIKLNGISMVNLVTAVGMLVDFVCHTGNRFYEIDAITRPRSVVLALEQIGSSILYGAISTLVGIIILAATPFPVFRIYFLHMYLGVVAIGTVLGFFCFPGILVLLGATKRNGWSWFWHAKCHESAVAPSPLTSAKAIS
jgi:predicted RND superfamily exporter protein